MKTATLKKWFYKAQDEMHDRLFKQYENISCAFHIVTSDRIVEYWDCQQKDGEEPEKVIVIITKNASDLATVAIYYVGSVKAWTVQQ